MPRDSGGQVCCLGKSAPTTVRRRAEFTGANQGVERAERVAAAQRDRRGVFEGCRYVLVRSGRGFAEVPGAALWLAVVGAGQSLVRSVPFERSRELDHFRSNQRVGEYDTMAADSSRLHADQAGAD